MKNFYSVLIALLFLTAQLKAQAPNQLDYQGVARDASGIVLPNQAISLRFTIHQGSAGGTVVYKETQPATTNQLGLFTAAIGSGTVVSGVFATIAWGTNTEYLQVEMDPTGGASYLDMGTDQFLSVPYALNAANAWNLAGNATSTYTFNATPTFNVVGTSSTGGSGFQFGVTGNNAGRVESAVSGNTALGYLALNATTALSQNTAIGYQALKANITGQTNTAMGYFALQNSNGGNNNVGIGSNSLQNNSGSGNTAVGSGTLNAAGVSGGDNTAIGQFALGANTTGTLNTGLGWNANVGSAALTNATAVGANASVTISNALVLGGTLTHAVAVGIGTTAPARELEIGGNTALVSTIRMDALASGGTFIIAPSATTDKIMYADLNGDIKTIPAGASGTVLTLTGGVPTWSAAASSGWGLTGNGGTTAGTNFIGTTDPTDLVFKTSGTEHLRIANSTGNVGIGIAIPAQPLDVAGNVQFSKALMPNTDPGVTGEVLESQGPNTSPIWTTITALAGGGDNWGSQTAITDSVATSGVTNTLNGNGTAPHPLTIAPQGATTGQILTWNGTKWAPATAAAPPASWLLAGNATGAYTFSATPTFNVVGTSSTGGSGFQFGVTGNNAGRVESAVSGNTALGYLALNATTALSQNTAIGYQALKANITGQTNTAMGYFALQNANGGNNNVGIGANALANNNGVSGNTAVGSGTLNGAVTGGDNTAIGQFALGNNTSGTLNTGLGWNANITPGTLTNATAVGANASVTTSNSLVLGGTGANAVKVGIGITAPNSTLQVSGSVATAFAAKTAAYPLTATDDIVTVSAATGAVIITLPTSAGGVITGRQYTIKKIDASANAVTIATTLSQTIDGVTTYTLSAQWKYVTVVSDGANWVVVANN